MDAAQALADLVEVSSQIESAVLLDSTGRVVAATYDDAGRAERVARAAQELVRAADEAAVRGGGRARLTQVLAETPEGAVLVVRDDERAVAAVTGPEPTVGLVFYDLKTCLRLAAETPPKPKRASARKRTSSSPQRKPSRKKDDA